jgi:hypothetical protein
MQFSFTRTKSPTFTDYLYVFSPWRTDGTRAIISDYWITLYSIAKQNEVTESHNDTYARFFAVRVFH